MAVYDSLTPRKSVHPLKRDSCPAVLGHGRRSLSRSFCNSFPLRLDEPMVALDNVLSIIANLGRMMTEVHAFPPEISPVVECLNDRNLEVRFKDFTSRVRSIFEMNEVNWHQRRMLLLELGYSLLALFKIMYLNLESLPFPQILSQLRNTPEKIKQLSGSITLINISLERLLASKVAEAPVLTCAQLLKYHRIAESYQVQHNRKSIDQFAKHIPSRDKENEHPLTIDPLKQRLFIHLRKRLPSDTLSDEVKYEALMVANGEFIHVIEVVYDYRVFSLFEANLKQRFINCPYITPPPLCMTKFMAQDSMMINSKVEKISLLCLPFFCNFSRYAREIAPQTKTSVFLPLLLDIAKGLKILHNDHYLHGGMTPENLIVHQIKKSGTMRGMIEDLSNASRVNEKGKKTYRRSIEKGVRSRLSSKKRRNSITLSYPQNTPHTPPECTLEVDSPPSLKGDIWAFGITAWQCVYAPSPESPLFSSEASSPRSIPGEKLSQIEAYKTLKDKLPEPQTMQEYAFQQTLRQCLYVAPEERLSSSELVESLEEVCKTTPSPYKPPFSGRSSFEEIFEPFNILDNGPKKALTTSSLPPQLFGFLTTEGNVDELIKSTERLVEEKLLKAEATVEEIDSVKQSLEECQKTLRSLERKCKRSKTDSISILKRHNETITTFKLKLITIQEKVQNSRVKGGAGLTYKEYGEILSFAKKQFRKLKKELKEQKKPHRLGEGPHAPCYVNHFPRGNDHHPKYSISLDPFSKSIFVHLKKRGSRGRELGKGAAKAVHEAVHIKDGSLTPIADVVIRKEDYDRREEPLKQSFVDCTYIEAPATHYTYYDKEEVPGLWNKKPRHTQDEIEEIRHVNAESTVTKIAFFCPQYTSSLSSVSYNSNGEIRDIPFIIKLLGDVAKGLSFMHSKNTIHRDLKAGNIFVKAEAPMPIAVVGDLGEAAKVEENGVLPAGAKMAGTEYYYSPEICYDIDDTRFRNQSFASDVWSFGVLACQVLYGKNGRDVPFLDNDSKERIQSQIKHLTQEDVTKALDGRFPVAADTKEEEVQGIIRCCLMIEPDERPSAQEIANAFERMFK